jgi:hypothetical protein
MDLKGLLDDIVGYVIAIATVMFAMVYVFRAVAAASARRRRSGQWWPRAVLGGAIDAFRYFNLRVARYADLSDEAMRTAESGTGNPPLNGGVFAFWVLMIPLASAVSFVLPALVFGLDFHRVLRVVDLDGAKVWLMCFTLVLPLFIVWRERELQRRMADEGGHWRAHYMRLVRVFGVPSELRAAIRREEEACERVGREIDLLGEAPEQDYRKRAAHAKQSRLLEERLRWHATRKQRMAELLERIELPKKEKRGDVSLPQKFLDELFDIDDAIPVPAIGVDEPPGREEEP